MLFKIIFIVFWIGILVLSPELCVFLTVGMAPAFVAYFVDIRPGKNTSATVTFFNFSGVIIPGMRFLHGDYAITFKNVLDPKILIIVYLFAAVGWFIVWLVPKITVIVVDYKNERRSLRIKEKMNQLIEEWGPEVRRG